MAAHDPGRLAVTSEPLRFAWRDGEVSGARYTPGVARRATIVLGHGAGGSMDHPSMIAMADALADSGFEAFTFNFPYTEAGRKAPDKQDRLEACYWGVAKSIDAEPLYLGGTSMGGRIASHIVAGGFPAAGLVLRSYPLHPPGKPERLRDEHLSRIGVPMLFLSGTRDPFATPDLLEATVARLKDATLHWIENADHGMKVAGRKSGDVLTEIVSTITAWIG
jgi:predicted alpha/beta-hydrolase family hydrolase